MKNNMKLIMEGWRENAEKIIGKGKIETVGDLRAFVKISRTAGAGKEAAKAIIEVIPVLGNVYNTLKLAKSGKEAFKKLYGNNDEFKTSTGLDKLDVNDDVSKIVDDKIEVAFLNDFLAKVSEMDDEEPIPDANEALRDFLKFKFNQHSVEAT